jgi:hypothetical protein
MSDLDKAITDLETQHGEAKRRLSDVQAKLDQAAGRANAAKYVEVVAHLQGERGALEHLMDTHAQKLRELREQRITEAAAARQAERAAIQDAGETLERVLAGQVTAMKDTLDRLAEIEKRHRAAGGNWSASVRWRAGLLASLRDALEGWSETRPQVLGLPPKPGAKERARAELEQKIKSAEVSLKHEEQRKWEPPEDSEVRDNALARARKALAEDRRQLANYG